MYVLPPLPRCSGWASSSLISPSRNSLPRKRRRVGLHIDLFGACSAFTRVAARTLAPSPICDQLHRRLQPFRRLHDCSGCFRLERLPGGALPLESAAFSRRTRQADVEKGGDECCHWAETGLTEVTSGRTGIRAIAVPLRGRNILHRTKMNSRADRQQPPHRRVDHHWAWKYGADRDTIFCALGGRVPRFCILLPLTGDRR